MEELIGIWVFGGGGVKNLNALFSLAVNAPLYPLMVKLKLAREREIGYWSPIKWAFNAAHYAVFPPSRSPILFYTSLPKPPTFSFSVQLMTLLLENG